MLYLIGLGLNKKGISVEGKNIAKKCKKIYIENYTVNYPYALSEISKILNKNIIPAKRDFVESYEIIDESLKKDVALLIYGSPLNATTHISLLEEAKKSRVKCRVIHAGSIFDGISETGLQLYKFGRTTSIPKWDLKKHFKPESFIDIIKNNQKINAHSLLLIDIDLNFNDALNELKETAEKNKIIIKSLIICQEIGTKKGRILYKKLEELNNFKGIRKPFCIIIPSKLSKNEEEFLRRF
jgi:diphthine synthase